MGSGGSVGTRGTKEQEEMGGDGYALYLACGDGFIRRQKVPHHTVEMYAVYYIYQLCLDEKIHAMKNILHGKKKAKIIFKNDNLGKIITTHIIDIGLISSIHHEALAVHEGKRVKDIKIISRKGNNKDFPG